MPLDPGQRLGGEGQSIYQIDACRAETPWYRLYSARKVFFNYRYHERELYEAAEDEWIEVQIRTPGDFDDASNLEVEQGKRLLRYEATDVLAKHAGWFPEPLDLIEFASPGSAAGERPTSRELALVVSAPHGDRLAAWSELHPDRLPWKLTVCLEILELLESLHRSSHVLGGFGPDDFVIDETSRLFCLAGDRVIPAQQSSELRPYFPPQRYPRDFAAPEVSQPAAALDGRSDLFSWASVTVFLFTRRLAEPIRSADANSTKPSRDNDALDALQASLQAIAGQSPDVLRGLSPRLARCTQDELVGEWLKAVRTCLAAHREERPSSVRELREQMGVGSRKRSFGKFWRQLAGR